MQASITASNNSLSAGIFSWDVRRNLVYADSAAAKVFGGSPDSAALGLPIERFLERVHPEDEESLRGAISQSLMTSEPFQAQYRTSSASGSWTNLAAFGHCFRSESGEAVLFSGILHPLCEQQPVSGALWHLIAAHQVFEQENHLAEARMVLRLLERLANPLAGASNVVKFSTGDA